MEKVKLSHFILLVMSILMAGCKNNYQGAGNENATSLKSDTVPYSVKFDFDNACEISTDLKKMVSLRLMRRLKTYRVESSRLQSKEIRYL